MMHFVLDSRAAESGDCTLETIAPSARRLALAHDGWREAAAELNSAPSARAVLFVRSAPSSVADQLSEGASAIPAMSAWRAFAELELNFFRPNRRRVLLLDADDAAADPDQTRAAVEAWYQDAVAPRCGHDLRREDVTGAPERQIAALLCASDPDMRALMGELAASCAWINQAPPPPPLEAACQAAERLTASWNRQTGDLEVWRDALEAAQTNLLQALNTQPDPLAEIALKGCCQTNANWSRYGRPTGDQAAS